jgi:two-component system, NarL family, nitrate/nitrite response regulator NarL
MMRLVIACETRFYRDGLAQALERYDNVTVVGVGASGAEACELAVRLRPDAVLVDTTLNDGLDSVRRISDVVPTAKTIAIAIVEAAHDVLQWAEAGVAGYVDRSCSLNDLLQALEGALRGELRCSPRIAAHILGRVKLLAARGGALSDHDGPDGLTPREHEILRLLGMGLSNKRIAAQLGITLATAKNHVHNIFSKLNVHHRAEAIARMHSTESKRG